VGKIKKIFTNLPSSQFGEYIKAKKVMQWGGLSDQFDENERKAGITLELLRFFKEINYPLCFSTKSVWWTKDERYMELFRGQKNWNVKVSIITLDADKSRRMEAGCPSPQERLQAIEAIAKAGCGGATLRLRPFIIGVSTPSYIDLIKQAGDVGATALSTEFFCCEQRSEVLRSRMKVFDEICGFDVFAFYKKYSIMGGYMRLNRKIKAPFIKKMLETCREVGMRFYVSDAHFKELCDNGSCCGLPCDWNYSRGQFAEALQYAKRNGKVHFSDILSDVQMIFSEIQWRNAKGYNTNILEKCAQFTGMSMVDYLRYLWNNPQCGQSPYKLFEGVIVPTVKDDNGDLIYEYKEYPL